MLENDDLYNTLAMFLKSEGLQNEINVFQNQPQEEEKEQRREDEYKPGQKTDHTWVYIRAY